MTTAGQCLQCGHRNSEGMSKCVRCDTTLLASAHPYDRPAASNALPWIMIGSMGFLLFMAVLMRQSPAPSASPNSPGSFGAPISEPPAEEVSVVAATNNGPAPGAPPAVAVIQGQWRSVVNIEGSGAKRTTTFPIAARFWRIRWTAASTSAGDSWIYGIIYRQNGKSVGMTMNGKGGSGGVTRLEGRGTYYIDVKSTQTWTMNVEQWY